MSVVRGRWLFAVYSNLLIFHLIQDIGNGQAGFITRCGDDGGLVDLMMGLFMLLLRWLLLRWLLLLLLLLLLLMLWL